MISCDFLDAATFKTIIPRRFVSQSADSTNGAIYTVEHDSLASHKLQGKDLGYGPV